MTLTIIGLLAAATFLLWIEEKLEEKQDEDKRS